jgi:hypothetical protein
MPSPKAIVAPKSVTGNPIIRAAHLIPFAVCCCLATDNDSLLR